MKYGYFIHLPMKMELIEVSETSAIRTQTPGNYPKENILHIEQGESWKPRINWLVFITETECVYCAVRTGSLNVILRSAHTAVFMCFVWIWEQRAIISLYSINLTGLYIWDGECLLRGTDWVFKCNSTFCPHSCIYVFCVDLRTNSDYFPIQH